MTSNEQGSNEPKQTISQRCMASPDEWCFFQAITDEGQSAFHVRYNSMKKNFSCRIMHVTVSSGIVRRKSVELMSCETPEEGFKQLYQFEKELG